MERLRDLAEFWNWLPAFRAVAETEHLPTASEGLGIGAPALSRSIRLLEKRLGTKLFLREGRGLQLNEEGKQLLAAARRAMAHVHEASLALRGDTFAGPVHIASSGMVTTSYLLPALLELRSTHPELVPVLSGPPPQDVVVQLRRGMLDVALTSDPIEAHGLKRVELGVETSGVYCGPGHPLYERTDVDFHEIAEHDFVGPAPTKGRGSEGWPVDVPRQVGAVVDQMRIGLAFCASGGYLAVLPDALARSYAQGVLRRLPVELAARVSLYGIHRARLGSGKSRDQGRAEILVEAVRKQIARTEQEHAG